MQKLVKVRRNLFSLSQRAITALQWARVLLQLQPCARGWGASINFLAHFPRPQASLAAMPFLPVVFPGTVEHAEPSRLPRPCFLLTFYYYYYWLLLDHLKDFNFYLTVLWQQHVDRWYRTYFLPASDPGLSTFSSMKGTSLVSGTVVSSEIFQEDHSRLHWQKDKMDRKPKQPVHSPG